MIEEARMISTTKTQEETNDPSGSTKSKFLIVEDYQDKFIQR